MATHPFRVNSSSVRLPIVGTLITAICLSFGIDTSSTAGSNPANDKKRSNVISGVRLYSDVARYDLRFDWKDNSDRIGVSVRLVGREGKSLQSAGFNLLTPLERIQVDRCPKARRIFLSAYEPTRFKTLIVWLIDRQTLCPRILLEAVGGDRHELCNGWVIEKTMAKYAFKKLPADMNPGAGVHRSWKFDRRHQRFVASRWRRS
jgi:hypothetical protein